MKQLKYLSMIALALVFGLTSCSNDDDAPGQGSEETQSVFLQIKQEVDNQNFRAIEQPKKDVTPTFSSGTVFFTDVNGKITNKEDLEKSKITNLTGDRGHTFEDIAGSARSVVIVGNLNAESIVVGQNKSDIDKLVMNREEVSIIDVENTPLYGSDLITITGTDTETTKGKSTVILKVAALARFEFRGVGVKEGSSITDFKVAGVFINNTYLKTNLLAIGEEDNILDQGTNKENYTEDKYKDYASLFDVNDKAGEWCLKENDYANPGNDNIWAYNLLVGGENPHIILHLTNVKIGDDADKYLGDQYVTIASYTSDGESDFEIKPGYIYTVESTTGGGIDIDEENLDPAPELHTFNVQVTAKIMKWKTQSIQPGGL